LFSYLNPLTAQGIISEKPFFFRLRQERDYDYAWAEYIVGTTHEQTIICRQLVAGHAFGLSANE